MKKLLTLLLTLALCVPMLMTTSVEVRAEEEGNEITYGCFHEECNGTAIAQNALCSNCKSSGQDGTTITYTKEGAGEGWHSIIEKCPGCGIDVSKNAEQCTFGDDGNCTKACGNVKPAIPCLHVEYCENTETDGEALCDFCIGQEATLEWWLTEDLSKHMPVEICACNYITVYENEAQDHEFNASGICEKCNYNPNCGSSTTPSKPTTSTPAAKAPTAEEIAEQRAEAISKAVEEKIKAEEAIPVADFVSAEAVKAIPEEAKGTSTEAVFNVSKITTTRGFVAAVDKIVKDNAKEKTVTFYSATPFAFNTDSLNALTNANKDFVYMFKHEGKLYKITIPAGAKIDLAGQKFAGPLYIGAKLGTSVVVK